MGVTLAVRCHLQKFAARTQFFPFRDLYALLYKLALRVCVYRLKRTQGVLSIYLRRGLASGEPVYGLSDIDLLVLVDEDNYPRAGARVRYQYECLRRRIPMLGAGELAVYHPRQFRELYDYSAFYRNRFEMGRWEWRRLYGTDVFTYLPKPAADNTASMLEELGPAWTNLQGELTGNNGQPLYQRRYLNYKAIADTARVTLAVQGDEQNHRRKAALARAAERYPELAGRLRQVEGWRRNLMGFGPMAGGELLELHRALAHEALAAWRKKPHQKEKVRRQRFRIQAIPDGELDRRLGEGAFETIRSACVAVEGIERAVIIPRISFAPLAWVGMDPASLTGVTIDAYDLVLRGDRFPSVRQLRELNEKLARFRPALEIYFCDGKLALALRHVEGTTVRTRHNAPELFRALERAATARKKVALAGVIAVERTLEQPDALERRARSLLEMFRRNDIYQLPPAYFFATFWEAARASCIALAPAGKAAPVPVTSRQVVESLVEKMPGTGEALHAIHTGYEEELRGEVSDLIRCTKWTSAFLARIEALLNGQEESALPALPPLKTNLTISVVIPVLNRAALLRRALQSLVMQERPADEVIIVDNGSEDGSDQVALSFRGRLPLKLAREEKRGVQHARNTGLKHSTGDIIACMDSDCVADRCWLAELEVPFLKDPRLGAVGGSVVPDKAGEGLLGRFYTTRMDTAVRPLEARPR